MRGQIMQHATDTINMQDDKVDGGMGLGNSMGLTETGPSIDLDKYKPTENPEFAEYDPLAEAEYWEKQQEKEKQEEVEPYKPEEEEDTTNYEQKLYEIEQEIENLEGMYESINNMNLNELFDTLSDQEFEEITGMTKNQWRGIYYGTHTHNREKNKMLNTVQEAVRENIGNQLQELRTTRDGYKNNENYDNRTDSQIREDELREAQQEREDKETDRAVEAMRKAGLNPATLSGNISYGGGGGISSGGRSKADEDEEERRKRKREKEKAEAEQKRQQQQMVMQIVQMLGGIGGNLGTAAIRNQGLMGMSRVRGEISGMNMENIEDYRRTYGHRSYNKRK